MLKIKKIEDKRIWEKFIASQKRQPFFQSWNWGEVNKALNSKIFRLGIFDDLKLVGVCLIVEIKAKRGYFFHLRHGPIIADFKSKYFDFFLKYVKVLASERGVSFLRISPLLENDSKMSFFKKRGFRESPIHRMDAEDCLVLSLDESEENLLKGMRKTTRYLIRRGELSGLKVEKAKNKSDIKIFLTLYKKIAQKHGFLPHRGIMEEFEIFKKDNLIELFLAKYKKKTVAGALVVFYGNQAVYHHGAQDSRYDRLSPSYFLQWEAILEAKRRGKKLYNFWGIAPEDKPNHPWAGLTLFKKGFGGQREEFLHSQDLPLSSKYWLTWALESFRRVTKGY